MDKLIFSNKLPAWLYGEQVQKLEQATQAFWLKVQAWFLMILDQIDASESERPLLDLLAWERRVFQLPDEPFWLFRLRVKYAFVNQRDAGSRAGLVNIFSRLNIPLIDVNERMPERDIDVVALLLADDEISQYPNIIPELIKKYGRACRRYELTTANMSAFVASIGTVQYDQMTFECFYDVDISVENTVTSVVNAGHFAVDNQVLEASIL